MRKLWKLWLISIVCVGVFLGWRLLYRGSGERVKGRGTFFLRSDPYDPDDQWMNVFIHGTFGSPMGLMDFSAVRNDEVEGSLYKRIVLMMRSNPLFLLEQPLLPERGLYEISPTFDVNDLSRGKSAYPLLKAFDVIKDDVFKEQHQNWYYVFGWSGLLSQKRRRKEAVRLYNALVEARDELRSKGFDPKIRILAHSHGGSVALNLGGIKEALEGDWSVFPVPSMDRRVIPIQKGMIDLLKSLPEKPVAVEEPEKWDYLPRKALVVDELLMFGTPLQVETAYFARSDLFGTVFNIYSDEDCVQEIDWLSTADGQSAKRFEQLDLCRSDDIVDQSRVVQVKVTVSRQIVVPGRKRQRLLWWRVLLGLDDIERKTQDPTHRELWFLTSPGKGEKPVLKPLPTSIFAPAISKLIGSCPRANDVDVDFSISKNRMIIRLFGNNHDKIQSAVSIPEDHVNSLRERLKVWIPGAKDIEKGRQLIESCVQLCKNTKRV